MRFYVICLALFLATLPSQALASESYGRVAGWEIVQDDQSCGIFMEYEGPGQTRFLFLKTVEGRSAISVENSGWSAVEGIPYDVGFVLNGSSYGGGKARGSDSSDGHRGFVSVVDNNFERDLAKGSTLHIILQDKEIDRLSLRGTSAAIDLLNRCLNGVKSRIAAAEKEKRRWSDLPKDPFANAMQSNRPATPKSSPSLWTTTNDYPSRALREERQGRVEFKLTIGSDGRVSSCKVVRSSGSADLDEAACANMTRRARFNPATDSNGQPTTGEYSSSVNWVIPADIPAPTPT